MKFKTTEDAWQHWMSLYEFHGAVPSEDEYEQLEMFRLWELENDVTYLEDDDVEFLNWGVSIQTIPHPEGPHIDKDLSPDALEELPDEDVQVIMASWKGIF